MADFDIGSILSSLSPEDMENIKKVAEGFMGNSGQPQKAEPQKQSGNVPPFPDLSGLGMPDLSQLTALVPIMQAFNQPDERLEFINALKPLLSQEKRRKADEAMKLVRLASVLPLLRERGIM
ncbi:MAG: hypothetical protein IIX14_05225 [Clostridia bacterium]|nr:hypothetical protein [Clostridia bacterium]